MTGDKPDQRLRTPMQWSPERGGGFTSGVPWESAQPDSATTTVQSQNSDPGSLLNLYRRLIHLRKTTPALADGRLVPLSPDNPQIVAYLRRAPGRAVLVAVNLGTTPVTATLRSGVGALPAGHYSARSLLGKVAAGAVVVGRDGAIAGYAMGLAPRSSAVLELVRR
jgi:glycosidase